MNLMAAKFFSRHGSNALRIGTILGRGTCDGPSPPPPKQEQAPCPPPSPSAADCCPQPPPCPPMPTCPNPLCPPNPDPNNPCNYCPPACIDPDQLDITRLKKLQCKFQEDNGLPLYLKGGKLDVVFYHTTLILLAAGMAVSFYETFKLITKA